jgi:hypothetical protein
MFHATHDDEVLATCARDQHDALPVVRRFVDDDAPLLYLHVERLFKSTDKTNVRLEIVHFRPNQRVNSSATTKTSKPFV